MPIHNYSTQINSEKTIIEIQKILVKHGANKIVIDYENQVPKAVTFCLTINERMVGFSLPANYRGVLKAMTKQKVPKRLLTQEQALRVAWRIIKDWVQAQAAIVEADLADLAEVFLPYAITPEGKTLYNQIKDTGMYLESK